MAIRRKYDNGGVVSDLITILILNWNGASDTSLLLDDIAKQQTQASGEVVDVFVLDNGSTIGPPDGWGQLPGTTVFRSPTNLGYSGGISLLLPQVSSEYVWVINNDTRLGTGALRKALFYAGRGDFDLGLPLVFATGFEVQSRDSYWRPGLGWRSGEIARVPEADGHPVFGDIFAAPVLRVSMCRELALFPAEFHTYGEDLDACYAIASAGGKTLRLDVELVHKKFGSKPTDSYERFTFEVRGIRNVIASAVLNYELSSYGYLFVLFGKLWIHELAWRRRQIIWRRGSAFTAWLLLPVSVVKLVRELRRVRVLRRRVRRRPDRQIWSMR